MGAPTLETIIETNSYDFIFLWTLQKVQNTFGGWSAIHVLCMRLVLSIALLKAFLQLLSDKMSLILRLNESYLLSAAPLISAQKVESDKTIRREKILPRISSPIPRLTGSTEPTLQSMSPRPVRPRSSPISYDSYEHFSDSEIVGIPFIMFTCI